MPPGPLTAAPSRNSTAYRPLNSTLQWVIWSALGLLIAGIFAAFVRQQWVQAEWRSAKPLDRLSQIPAFTLTERSGQPFSSESLKGQIWLADFFFTACPAACLTMNARMREIAQSLEREHANVRLVSFSVAPEQDTPAVLQKYARRFQAPPADRWAFLTGDHATIYGLGEPGFLLPLVDNSQTQPDPDQGEFIHSTRISLVDRAGVVRGSFDSALPEASQQILTAVGELLREQPAAQAGTRRPGA